jgi:signal transduction histidine kinase
MRPGISLSNKCQLLFGFVAIVILTAALAVPWMRSSSLVEEHQVELARELADVWLLSGDRQPSPPPPPLEELIDDDRQPPPRRVLLVEIVELEATPRPTDSFLIDAARRFRDEPEVHEHVAIREVRGRPLYRYARALRVSEQGGIEGPPLPAAEDPLWAVLLVDRASQLAASQLLISRIYILAAGLVGSLLAILAFYPVRALRETTERIQEGGLDIRSDIHTGDEFQELSEAFNVMLDRMELSQRQLRSINESLDLKVSELAEANVGLYESNRFKSEFLANVSHELRTPLNSIIGFSELLEEIARNEDSANPRQLRFLSNILSSSRSLLEMINELLDLAKIEAGRMEVHVEPTSVPDVVEGLVGIMGTQAERKRIELSTQVATNVPMVETDAGKLQQILFNFLSNAIKFTSEGGRVTISADRVTRQDNTLGIRLAVSDNGPGIPEDMQDVIFEKFRQIDSGHTREHAGTGLGLAICRELAQLIGATVSFVSKPGEGATFLVDLPQTHQPEQPRPLMGIRGAEGTKGLRD